MSPPTLSGASAAALLLLALAGCAGPEARLSQFLAQAEGYLESGQIELAEVELRNALRLDPGAPDALFLRARLLERQQAWAPLRETLEHVLELQPERIEANLMLGRMLVAGNALAPASVIIERLLRLDGDSADTHLLNAGYLYRNDELTAARAAAEQALALDPDGTDALVLLANLDWAEGAYDAGLDRVEQGLTRVPDDAPLHLLKVRLQLSQGEPDLAAETLAALIRHHPADLTHRRNLALLYTQGDQPERAEALLRDTVADLPNMPEAKLLLVQYLTERKPEAAVAQLQAFVDTGPDPDAVLALRLAQLLEQQGELADADAVYQSIVARHGRSDAALRARNQRARLAINNDRPDEARALADAVLAADPDNPDALFIRAWLQLQDGQVNDAIVNLRTVLRAERNSDRALLLLGRAYQRQQSNDLARESFARSVELNPYNLESVKRLLPYYLAEENHEQADLMLTRVLEADRGDSEILLSLIQVKLAREQFPQAENLALRAANELDQPEIARYVRGISLRSQGRAEAAIPVFEEVLAINPTSTQALTALIDAYAAADQRSAGISRLRQALEERPDHLAARNLLAQELARSGNWPEAVDVLETAISRAPNSLDAYTNLAQGYIREGDLAAAAATFERAIDANPEAVGLRLALASLYERMGQVAGAEQQYTAALTQQPGLDLAANNLAMLLSTDPGRLDEAHGLVAHFKDSRQAVFLDTLGWIQVLRGEHEQGAALLRRAYEAAPDAREIAYHLGVAMHRMGRPEEAKRYLEAAVANGSDDRAFGEDARKLLELL